MRAVEAAYGDFERFAVRGLLICWSLFGYEIWKRFHTLIPWRFRARFRRNGSNKRCIQLEVNKVVR